MQVKIITNQKDFDELVQTKLKQEKYISIDTEFDRRRTYFAILSFIQICTENDIYIIDALIVKDLNLLKEILYDESILKIIHAPEQDFEIFYNLFKAIPKNFFDTQIAAKLCGLKTNISYGDLCYQLYNIKLDKKLQDTNWLVRPISQSMADYMCRDVEYLKNLYDILNIKLNNLGKYGEYLSLTEKIFKQENYQPNPQNAWTKIYIPPNFSKLELDIVKSLAYIRTELAIKKNVPRKYIATNNDILILAINKPSSLKDLKKINISRGLIENKKLSSLILNLITGITENIY